MEDLEIVCYLVEKVFTNEDGENVVYNQLIYKYDDEEICIPIKKTIAQMIRICEKN